MDPLPSNIAIAVDAEIAVLQRRLETLRKIRELADELEDARLPRAAAALVPPPATAEGKRPSRRQPPLKLDDVLEPVREMLADGPLTIAAILRALGRDRSPHAVHTLKDALTQLGARRTGTSPGGGDLFSIEAPPLEPDADDDPPTPDFDRHELELRLADLAEKAYGWSNEEYSYQLRKRHQIEATPEQVAEVLLSMEAATR